MLLGTDAVRKSLSGRWILPPWDQDSPEWIALDERLSANHPARSIDALVQEMDLEAFAKRYAGVGRRAYRPDFLLKVVLFEISQGELSPAQWARDVRENEPLRWLLFGLEPSRTCLYDFRDLVSSDLDDWQQQLLHKARTEGHTEAERGALDGTLTAAYGSRHRLINAEVLDKRWQQLEAQIAADGPLTPGQARVLAPMGIENREPEVTAGLTDPAQGAPPTESMADQAAVPSRPYWMARTLRGRQQQRVRYQQARQRMQELQTQYHQFHKKRSKRQRRPLDRLRVSPTEPEAALGMDKLKTFRPLYNVQLVRDLDTPFVLGYEVFAKVSDHDLLIPVVEKTQEFTGRRPRILLGDGIYATVLDLLWCRDQGITIYAPLGKHDVPALRAKNDPKALIPKSAFTWLPEQQTYRCPEGHALEFKRRLHERRGQTRELTVLQYGCAPEHCLTCPRHNQCTPKPERGRTIKRSQHEDLVDALRQRMDDVVGKEIYKLRKQTVELGFADFKQHRGLRCFRSYGRTRARTQVGLLILAHNGLALLKSRENRAACAESQFRETG